MNDIVSEKQRLRQRVITVRSNISLPVRKKADRRIARTFFARKELATSQTKCLYVSLSEEVDTRGLLTKLLRLGKTICVPRIVSDKNIIIHQIQSMLDLTIGPFHILEPKESCPIVAASSIDLFIVSGIAFDRKGYRLGWGKGYYDHLLADVKAPKIGLAYSCQLLPRLPHEKYDIPMDVVITEKETINLKFRI